MKLTSLNGSRLYSRTRPDAVRAGKPSRALAWVLTMCLLLTLTPALAFAEEGMTVSFVDGGSVAIHIALNETITSQTVPEILTPAGALPNGVVGEAYTTTTGHFQLVSDVTGGSWRIVGGTFPPHTTVSGTIFNSLGYAGFTPTRAGTYTFSLVYTVDGSSVASVSR